MPSPAAVIRARELFESFARTFEDVSPFEVAIAVDGAIEITALIGKHFLTADISPAGRQVEAILDEPESGAVAWSSSDTSAHEILREIERAA